ncbi:MAG: hypothetical protein SNJ64_00665 [Endomicrobiia bacterium]
MNYYFRFTIFLVVFFSLLETKIFSQEIYICVWRNPERTMTKIFKDANDYKTITKKISSEQREIIEKMLGSKLLPGQRETYQYYEMLDASGNILGYTIAGSQKGEYGAIEFVFGLDINEKINGLYIQRSREKDKEFRNEEFLKQFIGKGIQDIINMEIDKEIRLKKTVGTTAILLGLKKEVITFFVLKK